MNFPRHINISVDSREQRPLLFPDMIEWSPSFGWDTIRLHLHPKKVKLDAGDYLLTDWPTAGIVETKRSFLELFSNLLTIKDRPRALRAFKKLDKACSVAYIVLEGTPSTMYKNLRGFKMGRRTITDPGIVVDRMWEIIAKYNFGIIWAGGGTSMDARRIFGEIIVRILLRHAYDEWRTKQ